MVGTVLCWTVAKMGRWIGCVEVQICPGHSDHLGGLKALANLVTSRDRDDRKRRHCPGSGLSNHCMHMRDLGALAELADIMLNGRVRAEQGVLKRTASNRTSADLVDTD